MKNLKQAYQQPLFKSLPLSRSMLEDYILLKTEGKKLRQLSRDRARRR